MRQINTTYKASYNFQPLRGEIDLNYLFTVGENLIKILQGDPWVKPVFPKDYRDLSIIENTRTRYIIEVMMGNNL